MTSQPERRRSRGRARRRPERRGGGPAWAGRQGSLRHPTSQATWLAGCLDKSATPSWSFLTVAVGENLIEVCRSPTSGLSQSALEESEADSAIRISGWSGFDPSAAAGLQETRAEGYQTRPTQSWFFTPRGPRSGNQNFNENKLEVWGANPSGQEAIEAYHAQLSDAGDGPVCLTSVAFTGSGPRTSNLWGGRS